MSTCELLFFLPPARSPARERCSPRIRRISADLPSAWVFLTASKRERR